MSAVVVIGESDTCLVVTTSQHAGRSLFFGELLFVLWFVGGVGCEAANHFLVLVHFDALALDLLDVLQARKNLTVDSEDDLHLVGAAFLDGEWVLAQGLDRARLGEVDDDRGSAYDFL